MSDDKLFRATVGWAFPALVAWALLAALWNFGGVWRMAQGLGALGPTASALFGLILIAIAAGLIYLVNRSPLLFVLLALISGTAATLAVYGAFTQDRALWPSEAWRWAGIMLNVAGSLAAAASIVAYSRHRSTFPGSSA
jgi:hypothetical protein